MLSKMQKCSSDSNFPRSCPLALDAAFSENSRRAAAGWQNRHHRADDSPRRHGPAAHRQTSAYGDKVLAIEVKSGRNKGALAGLKLFSTSFSAVPGLLPGLLIGTGGIALEEFLAVEPESWMCV